MSEPAGGNFAILTPPGRGGIAVIRCVGPGARAAIARCFRSSRTGAGVPAPGALAYGHVLDERGSPLDEVIVHAEGPAALEVNCHGGPAAVEAVCGRLAALGLMQVDADRLLELEGVPRIARQARRALRRATTPLAARILLDQLNGALAREILDIARLLACAHGACGPACAAAGAPGGAGAPDASPALCLPAGGAGQVRVGPDLLRRAGRAASRDDLSEIRREPASAAIAAIDALLDRWRTCGRFLVCPPRIAVAGRPNAGKSTLVNRLAGSERVITSAAPGTTRDYVEVEAALEGMPAVVVDTAGLREPHGEIERQGVARTEREMARAEAVLYLVDAAEGFRPEDAAAVGRTGGRAVVVLNKIDLCPAAGRDVPAGGCAISALTGEGVPALVQAVLARLGWRAHPAGAAVPFASEQAGSLQAAREALAAGRAAEASRILASLDLD